MHLMLVDNLLPPYQGRLDTLDIHPHLGLISLGAVAQQNGHSVSIYDPKRLIRFGQLPYDVTLYERAARQLLDARPDVVGFTTLGCSFIFALKVASFLKRLEPNLPILLGGPHATMLHREIMEQFLVFDVVVRYEAENTLPGVLAQLERRDFTNIPGITWRASDHLLLDIRMTDGAPTIEDVDTLPMPAYDLYPIDFLDLDYMRIEAGRGCPFACTFCSTASFFHRDYRLKTPQKLVSQLDLLNERYGVTEFKLDHDLFTVNQKKVAAFCEAVKGRGYTWRVSARVDCVNEKLLENMAEAGCVGLYFGIETGSKRMQKVAKKRLDLDLVEPTLDITERLNIRTTASFITGYPQEDQEDQEATLDMLGRLFSRPDNICTPQLHMLMPEPGTELYIQLSDRLQYDAYITDYNAWIIDETDEQFILNHPDIFSTYYFYPTIMPRKRYSFAVDACRELRVLGNLILSYALRFYDGRLSRLIGRLYDWADARQLGASLNDEHIIKFFIDEYGEGHHLVSLVRYALTVQRGSQHPSSNPDVVLHTVDPNQQYQLAHHASVFSNLHNCGELVERISNTLGDMDPFEDRDAGESGCYLVVRRGGRHESLANYPIAPAIYAILTMFATPNRISDVSVAVAQITGGIVPADSFWKELVDIGALEYTQVSSAKTLAAS